MTARPALIAALEAEASRHDLEREQVERTARTMTKPGEQSTRRELDRRARELSSVVRACREAARALKGSALAGTAQDQQSGE